MNPRINHFLPRISSAGIFLLFGTSARADLFDTNNTTLGFGVTNGSTYDWWTAGTWSDTTTVNDGTAATVTWQGTSGVSEQAFFVGSGVAGENYTVRLGGSGNTNTFIQNLALNVEAGGAAAMSGAAGNVTIGNTGDTGQLIIRTANSVGAQNGGTITINNAVNLNAQTFNFRGGNVVINGVVSGTGASKFAFGATALGFTAGPGTLTLASTANTYAGRANSDYIIANFTLAVTKLADGGLNSSIGTSSANIGINGGTLKYIGNTGAQSTNLGFHIASGGVFMDASGVTSSDTISISGAPTYSAANSARAITLTGANAGTNTIAFAINNNGSGVNSLTKTGMGKWVLTQANGYTGATAINGGILALSGSGTTGSGSALNMGGGQLDLGGLSRSVGAVSITSPYAIGNTITNGSLTATSYAASNVSGGNAVVSANLLGSGTLTKSGAGTLTLTGTNTFTGSITINDGNIVINNSDALGTSATTKTVTITAGANKFLDLDSTVSGGSNITLSSKINFLTSGINGVIRNFAGTNEVLGTISLTSGNGNSRIISNGGVLTLSGAISCNAGAGGVRTLDLDGASAGANTVSGVISNGSFTLSLEKNGIGNWTVSNANTFTGNTKVNGGTLKLANNLAIQNSAFDTAGAGTLDTSGVTTPTFGGLIGDAVTGQDLALNASVTSLRLNLGTGVTQTYAKNFSGGTAMELVKSGAGTQILSGSNSYSGATTINGGTLQVASNNALGNTSGISTTANNSLQLANGVTISGKTISISGYGSNVRGALQAAASASAEWAGPVLLGSGDSRVGAMSNATLTISGAIGDGTGNSLVVSADVTNGKVIVSGANTYTGATQIIRGTLALGADNSLPAGSVLSVHAASGVADSAVFDLNGYNQQVGGLLRGNTSGPATVTNSGGSGKTLTISNTGNWNFDSAITGNLELVKSGTGNQTLSGTNTFNGGSRIDTGTLTLGHATDTLRDDGAVNVNGGILDLGTNTDTVGAVTLKSGAITGSGAGRLTAAGSNFDVRSGSISAKLGGSIGLDKTTGATVTISSDNSLGGYTGATTVTAGTLLINGNITTSTLTTVSGTGTLGGSGTVGATTVNAGGTLSPGNSIDSLDIAGDLTLGAGSFSLFEIDTAGNISDLAIVSGLLTFGGTLNVNNVGATLVSGDTFDLFNWGTISGTFSAVNLPGLDPGLTWDDTALYTNGTITVIPEPRAALLGGLGILMLLRRRRVS